METFSLAKKDEFIYHEAMVHPAMLLHPHPRRVLIMAEEKVRLPVKCLSTNSGRALHGGHRRRYDSGSKRVFNVLASRSLR